MLLLGDPGTGKSQLLQAAQELVGRSVRTSGLGCTNAGSVRGSSGISLRDKRAGIGFGWILALR